MASQCSDDWQSTKKTVLERSCYMFNNPLLSDITFTCEGKRKQFYGHKYVLATSSAVFYAMFYGDLAERNSVIHLPDTDEASFEQFLRFLYTDDCSLTPEIAVKVMYLAKKYIVPPLTEKCVEVIEENMTPENVMAVLEKAIQFAEKDLQKNCWKMVDLKTTEAITSETFTTINQETLINLLKRDTLNIPEIKLFQAVLKWSENECCKRALDVTCENMRAVLGDAVYHMRFLSMSEEEFTQHVSFSGLFSAEEMLPIYGKFNGYDAPDLKWKLGDRQPPRLRCGRFSTSLVTRSWGYYGSADGLSFTVNMNATFHGVRLFGDKNSSKYEVSLDVNGTKVSGTYTSKINKEGIYGYDVMLPAPVLLHSNQKVTMLAAIKGPQSCAGSNGKASVQVGKATVSFTGSELSQNGTNVTGGQFHEIILSI